MRALRVIREPADGDGPPTLRGAVVAGTATIVLAFGGFLGWAFLAPLDSAAIGAGAVIADSHRKTIDHLEGGIVRQLLIKEGDRVDAGQVLVRLEDRQARAVLGQVRGQYFATRAQIARLLAELEDAADILFPDDLSTAAESTQVAELVNTQRRYFRARRRSHDGLIAVHRKRLAQLGAEISALGAQEGAAVERLGFAREELASVRALLSKGYERKPRLLKLQSDIAALKGRRGQLRASIAKARQEIAETELEIIGIDNQRRTEIVGELQGLQERVGDLRERLDAALDVLERTTVVAPLGGKVVALKVFTVGGVIGAGEPILDLVPEDDELIVAARINPTDIDVVRVGQAASVTLSAYKQKKVPPISGQVIHVSADHLADKRTGEPYFEARIRLDAASLGANPGVELYPGMPTETAIATGERRAIDYFLSPITQSMRRAFTED